MPPKIRITREELIQAAIKLVRQNGEAALNARNLAAELNCSTQPVFSNFKTMEELRAAVLEEAERIWDACVNRVLESGEYPPYKAYGMAYIRFAQEEKELFKLLYMCERSDEEMREEKKIYQKMTDMVKETVRIQDLESKLFHLEMWAVVHGIASMIATGYLQLEWELISRMVSDTYQGLKKQYEERREEIPLGDLPKGE